METTSRRYYDTRKDNRKRKYLWSLLALLFVLLAIMLGLWYMGFFSGPEQPARVVAGDMFPGVSEAEYGFINDMSDEDLLAFMQRIADESMFSFKINVQPFFRDGASPGNFEIENPHYNVYPMVVQVALDETGEIIYDSGGLMPDQHIKYGRLNRVLPAGRHSATAHLYCYDPVTLMAQGESEVKLTLVVQN